MPEHGARAEASLDILMVRDKDIRNTRKAPDRRQPKDRRKSDNRSNDQLANTRLIRLGRTLNIELN